MDGPNKHFNHISYLSSKELSRCLLSAQFFNLLNFRHDAVTKDYVELHPEALKIYILRTL